MNKSLKSVISSVLVIGALSMSITMTAPVAMAEPDAPSAITYSSGITIQNLNRSASAAIVIDFYDRTTGSVAKSHSDTLTAGASKTYFPLSVIPGFPSSFDGSAVVSSDQMVAAIADLRGDSGGVTSKYFDTTGSFAQGAVQVNLPLVMKANYGLSTFTYVQNAGTAAASIYVNYSNGTSKSATNVQPGAAAKFDQGADADLGVTFVGSAIVTSTQPIVASVMQVAETGAFQVLIGYNGFVDNGSPALTLPLIMGNNYGFYTGVQVQNNGPAATTVYLSYGPNGQGNTMAPVPEAPVVVDAGKSTTILQFNGGQWGEYGTGGNGTTATRYVGSAIVTNTMGYNLSAIVNQVCVGSKTACGVATVASNYTSFLPTAGATTIAAPLIYGNYYGWHTGVQILNVGTGTCTNVTMTFGANQVGAFAPVAETVSNLAPNSSSTILQFGVTGSNTWGTHNPEDATKRYYGNAFITGTGTGCSILGIVNQAGSLAVPVPAGDSLSTYMTFGAE